MASDHRSQDTPPREWTGPGTVWVGHHEPGLALVTPRGEHDLSTVRVLRPACEKPTAHSNVLVDLSHCTFYRLEIISTLLSAAHTVTQRNEQLVLVTHRSSDWSHAAQPCRCLADCCPSTPFPNAKDRARRLELSPP